jgi:uncharacterized protein YbjT (DUF2867 family)
MKNEGEIKMIYAITGATGNIGRRIAESLLANSKDVRVIGRSAERLQPLVDKGAQPFVGDLEDSVFLTEAFSGAGAVFLMIPPSFQEENFRAYQNRVGESIATALQNSGVKYALNLSSLGAHLPEGTGPITGLYDQEQRLNQIPGLHLIHLRPTYFMENLFHNIDLIKHHGINGSPLKPDLAIPMIATQDIAAVGTEYLLNLDFSGKSVQELLGPEDISMQEVTRLIGKAITKPDLPYVQFSYEDAAKTMVQMGLSEDLAGRFMEMNRAINEGHGIAPLPRTEKNTTPTSFKEFAGFFADAYRG